MNSQTHVYVAISGGVDSAVAARKLLDKGFRVTGIHMQTWVDPEGIINAKQHEDPTAIAQQTADLLGIPLILLDVRDKFHSDIVQPFIDGYVKGLTPNPCLCCNPKIKWDVLQNYAFTHGGDFFATGHYARVIAESSGRVRLFRGVDQSKDQSYVLSMLSQAQLKRTLLPLGEMEKVQVLKEAAIITPDLRDRDESQDLCFLGSMDYREFLLKHAPDTNNPGKIINLEGRTLGEHKGLAFYTIGQRKGIRIAAPEPYYVVGKDIEKNHLIVGYANQAGRDTISAGQAIWISGSPPAPGESYEVMVRYRTKPVSAELSAMTSQGFRIKLSERLRDISPGQVVVIYQGEECLGGGVIQEVWNNERSARQEGGR